MSSAGNGAPGCVVMIVEDDPDSRDILSELVEFEGFRTVVASNGREALAELEAAKREKLPCVILLDIMMPVMDGRQFRAAQQQDPMLHAIPVVVLSAHLEALTTLEAMRANAVLAKPVDFSKLIEVVRELCS